MNTDFDSIDWEKGAGLVPAIVQDADTGRVLMLGYMNRDALQKTLSSRQVTFFSRSRQRLWTKGETSGNTLELEDVELDCDKDALLVNATPSGPTCHLNKASCFDGDIQTSGSGFIVQLEAVISDRLKTPDENSYTTKLLNDGVKRIGQKIGEEGVEVALAAMTGDNEEIIDEAADLMFHLLVLLRHQGLSFTDVTKRLKSRCRC
jgi:phosphoribosyl-ATP pyrophosphohydrolase/phosphoribosyl-AMP cyclohydrolase